MSEAPTPRQQLDTLIEELIDYLPIEPQRKILLERPILSGPFHLMMAVEKKGSHELSESLIPAAIRQDVAPRIIVHWMSALVTLRENSPPQAPIRLSSQGLPLQRIPADFPRRIGESATNWRDLIFAEVRDENRLPGVADEILNVFGPRLATRVAATPDGLKIPFFSLTLSIRHDVEGCYIEPLP